MDELFYPGSWIVIFLGAFYAPRPARRWARHFMRSVIGIQPPTQPRIGEIVPEWELEAHLSRAAWQGYWKGVMLTVASLLAGMAISSGNFWFGVVLYALICIAVVIRSLNRDAPSRLW